MKIFIVLFGVFIIAAALIMMIRPAGFIALFKQHAGSRFMHVGAIVVRLALGFVLIAYADQSRFPLALKALGAIAVAAAIALTLLSGDRFRRLINWFVDRLAGFIRPAGIFAVLLGAFLIYAVSG